jgi:hypothetical protein
MHHPKLEAPMRAIKSRSLALIAAFASFCCGYTGFAAEIDHNQSTGPGYSFYGDPGAPDISGLWFGTFTVGGKERPQGPYEDQDITHWAPWPAPLQPAYQKLFDDRVAAAKKGRQLGDLGARCLPLGMPVEFALKVYPDEIIQTPGQVSLWVFGLFPIVIWTDGRPHPKDLKPSYNGHSIGYWEGDTLHVDTVGIVAATPITAVATPHSAELRIETTIRRVAKDRLHLHVTLFDNEAFTEPMVATDIFRRKSGAKWEVLDDGSCFENNRNQPDDTGATGFKSF